MPFDIKITLSDEDLERFQESIDKGKLAVSDEANIRRIEDAASKLIEHA